MKIKIKELKTMIKEDFFMRGVPDFVIKQSSDSCIQELKCHLLAGINQRSKSPKQRREMIAIMNSSLKDLQKEINELVEERMSGFLQEL